MPCHTPKNIGPMVLDNYFSAKAFANMIHEVVVSKVMPPYQVEPSSCNEHLIHNTLSKDEIVTIKSWIDQGYVEGEKTQVNAQSKSVSTDSVIIFSMKRNYEIKLEKEEHTQIYVIPNDRKEDFFTNKIEFVPGLKSFIKSAFVFIDTTEQSNMLDKMDLNYGYTNYSSVAFKPAAYAWYGWNSFDGALELSKGFVKKIPAHSKILLQVTYKLHNKPYSDSSSYLKVWKYSPTSNDKTIYSNFIIDSTDLLVKPFIIKRNDMKTVRAEKIVANDTYIHSITPFGQNFLTSWNIQIVNDKGVQSPLLNIPQWDMHWKKAYQFDTPILVKKGSKIIADAIYNFTEENIRLPIIPLGRVPYGEGPKNELFLVAMDVSY